MINKIILLPQIFGFAFSFTLNHVKLNVFGCPPNKLSNTFDAKSDLKTHHKWVVIITRFVGHHFLVEMDMSSFPHMLKLKQKTVSHPQLFRWAEWFSKFFFETKHTKGKNNVFADFLLRSKVEIFTFKRTY